MDLANRNSARHRMNYQSRRNLAGYLLSAPLLIGISVFIIYPMVQALIYSFQKTNGMSGKFIGLKNYSWILNDELFLSSIGNTFYMAVFSVITGVVVCFVLASMINSLLRAKNMFKGLFFLPNVVSMVAVALLFKFIMYPTNNGLLNYVLDKIGIQPIGWLTDPRYARSSIVLMNLWKSIGYDTIIFLAGLQSVPRELYEAAEVDGANGLKKWFHITLPSMKPVFQFIIIMYMISSLKRFSDVYMIGGISGNPAGVLQTMVLYIYRNGWETSNVGVASAAAYVLFLLSLVITLLNYRALGVGKRN